MTGGREMTTQDIQKRLVDFGNSCDAVAVTPLPTPTAAAYRPAVSQEPPGPARRFSHARWSPWGITSYSGITAGITEMETAAFPEAPESTDIPGSTDTPEETRPVAEASPDSALEDQLLETRSEPAAAPAIVLHARSIHTFPRGPEPGTFLHDLLEWGAGPGFDLTFQEPDAVHGHLELVCSRHGWEEWTETLAGWFLSLLGLPLYHDAHGPEAASPFCLKDLSRQACRAEMEFLFAATGVDTHELDRAVQQQVLAGVPRPGLKPAGLTGMLKGFIDLVYCYNDRYYVMDYKSNHLGDHCGAYDQEAMVRAMGHHRYDLQYVLYTLALHRLLKSRLANYDYDRHVGGAVYLFLRGVDGTGNGVFVDRPDRTLIETLDHDFSGRKGKGK